MKKIKIGLCMLMACSFILIIPQNINEAHPQSHYLETEDFDRDKYIED